MRRPSSRIREEIERLQEQLKLAETKEAERIGRQHELVMHHAGLAREVRHPALALVLHAGAMAVRRRRNCTPAFAAADQLGREVGNRHRAGAFSFRTRIPFGRARPIRPIPSGPNAGTLLATYYCALGPFFRTAGFFPQCVGFAYLWLFAGCAARTSNAILRIAMTIYETGEPSR